jgi:hypothetical protein
MMHTLITPLKYRSSRVQRAYLERVKNLQEDDQDRKQALIRSAEYLLRISLELEKEGHKLPD